MVARSDRSHYQRMHPEMAESETYEELALSYWLCIYVANCASSGFDSGGSANGIALCEEIVISDMYSIESYQSLTHLHSGPCGPCRSADLSLSSSTHPFGNLILNAVEPQVYRAEKATSIDSFE